MAFVMSARKKYSRDKPPLRSRSVVRFNWSSGVGWLKPNDVFAVVQPAATNDHSLTSAPHSRERHSPTRTAASEGDR